MPRVGFCEAMVSLLSISDNLGFKSNSALNLNPLSPKLHPMSQGIRAEEGKAGEAMGGVGPFSWLRVLRVFWAFGDCSLKY